MPRIRISRQWFLAALFLAGSRCWVEASEPPSVSIRARSLELGEVAVLKVVLPNAAQQVDARAFARTFPFYQGDTGEGTVWEGLIGIDLGAEPGAHQVRIKAYRDGVVTWQTDYSLKVLDKDFPVRRLTVDEKYVSPPQEELDRIRMESEKVSTIFSRSTEQKYWKGTFLRPVPGKAISSFGKRSVINGQPRSPHTGTDFRAAAGVPVKAPNAGLAVLVQDLYFAGNTVILDHGQGLYSYFAHLSKFEVREGEFVEQGQVLGEVGSTGRVTGPHLHWTLRLAGARVDPLSLLSLSLTGD